MTDEQTPSAPPAAAPPAAAPPAAAPPAAAPTGAPSAHSGPPAGGHHHPGGGHRSGPGRPREGGHGGPGGPRRGKRQFFRKKKVCRFCVERLDFIDYKKPELLQSFIQDRGKIVPRRITGTCSRHQRWLGVAIKRARNIALLPFGTEL